MPATPPTVQPPTKRTTFVDASGVLMNTSLQFLQQMWLAITTAFETLAPIDSPTFTGTVDASGLFKGKGTTTNDSAAAGYIGEVVSATVASGDAVNLTNATWANITSINLTAGDWVLTGFTGLVLGATTKIFFGFSSMSTVSANGSSEPVVQGNTGITDNYDGASGLVPHNAVHVNVAIPATRFSLSAPATIYLERYLNFSTSTAAAFGAIWARRFR